MKTITIDPLKIIGLIILCIVLQFRFDVEWWITLICYIAATAEMKITLRY